MSDAAVSTTAWAFEITAEQMGAISYALGYLADEHPATLAIVESAINPIFTRAYEHAEIEPDDEDYGGAVADTMDRIDKIVEGRHG